MASLYYYNAARGLDDREVESHRQRKSIGSEKTFDEDLKDPKEMLEKLHQLAAEVWQEMQQKEVTARTITVKVKFDDFVQVTRAKTVSRNINEVVEITVHLQELLHKAEIEGRRVRLLGVTVSNLDMLNSVKKEQQLSLL